MMCPEVIGHRCNSMRTAVLYRLLGVTAVEVDVRLGPEGEVIVGHGGPWVARPSPTGRVAAALDYILFSRDPLIARRRPLSKWLSTLSWTSHILIDLKDRIEPRKLVREIELAGLRDVKLSISTARHDTIPSLKEALPEATVVATIRDWILNPISYIEEVGADGVSIPLPVAVEGYAAQLRQAGYKVYVWTLNADTQIKAVANHADAIITDAPWKARAVLHRLCRSGEAR